MGKYFLGARALAVAGVFDPGGVADLRDQETFQAGPTKSGTRIKPTRSGLIEASYSGPRHTARARRYRSKKPAGAMNAP